MVDRGGAGAGALDGYPSKAITIVAPQSVGSLVDRVSRLLAPEISKAIGRTVVIDNQPGNQGLAGSKFVATQAPADGYTLLITTLTNIASFAVIGNEPGFDAPRDLIPVACIAEGRIMFGVGAQQPWQTFDTLISHARAHPDALIYGASSTSNRLKNELIFKLSGVKVRHRLFDGPQAYQQTLVDGSTHMGLTTESAAVGWGDKVRYLAQSGQRRSAQFPAVPTFAELGLARIGEVGSITYVLNARTGTPAPAIDKLNAAIAQALDVAAVREQLGKYQLEIPPPAHAEAKRRLADNVRLFAEIDRQVE